MVQQQQLLQFLEVALNGALEYLICCIAAISYPIDFLFLSSKATNLYLILYFQEKRKYAVFIR